MRRVQARQVDRGTVHTRCVAGRSEMSRSTRRFAAATAVATFLLLLVGGLVNPTGSSLACPDWPLCYGSPFPPMVGGILYEHSHRLLATGVGLLTVVLAVLLFRDGKG